MSIETVSYQMTVDPPSLRQNVRYDLESTDLGSGNDRAVRVRTLRVRLPPTGSVSAVDTRR